MYAYILLSVSKVGDVLPPLQTVSFLKRLYHCIFLYPCVFGREVLHEEHQLCEAQHTWFNPVDELRILLVDRLILLSSSGKAPKFWWNPNFSLVTSGFSAISEAFLRAPGRIGGAGRWRGPLATSAVHIHQSIKDQGISGSYIIINLCFVSLWDSSSSSAVGQWINQPMNQPISQSVSSVSSINTYQQPHTYVRIHFTYHIYI